MCFVVREKAVSSGILIRGPTTCTWPSLIATHGTCTKAQSNFLVWASTFHIASSGSTSCQGLDFDLQCTGYLQPKTLHAQPHYMSISLSFSQLKTDRASQTESWQLDSQHKSKLASLPHWPFSLLLKWYSLDRCRIAVFLLLLFLWAGGTCVSLSAD
jgi:hypothetical protein